MTAGLAYLLILSGTFAAGWLLGRHHRDAQARRECGEMARECSQLVLQQLRACMEAVQHERCRGRQALGEQRLRDARPRAN